MLLAGDLFDSAASYRDTAEELSAALGQMEAQVYIAPGNHDWYGPGSPYLTVKWPENVHIFTQPRLETMEWPEKNLVLHGAAFTHGEQADGFLTGLHRPRRREAPYRPAPRGDRPLGGPVRSHPQGGDRRPAALPIWRWDTSTSGRSL